MLLTVCLWIILILIALTNGVASIWVTEYQVLTPMILKIYRYLKVLLLQLYTVAVLRMV